MSAEAFFTESNSVPVQGRKCRYCARVLNDSTDPRCASAHCQSSGCPWCAECADGLTAVSPIRKETR